MWDLILIGILVWEGYRYTARMPPRSPFSRAEVLLSRVVLGVTPFTPQQAAYSISETLYAAPRLFFWGVRRLQRITWPSPDMTKAVEALYGAMRTEGRWLAFERLQQSVRSREEAARGLAMLVKVGLARGRSHDGELAFRVCDPEWA